MTSTSTGFKAGLHVGFTLVIVCSLFSLAAAQTCVQPPAGLVSWWPGDGNADDIQNGNDGTPQNGATFVAGKVGQAFSFDGVNDHVQIPHNANLDPGTSSFSLDTWVKTTQATGSQVVVGKYECGQTCIPFVSNSFYFLNVNDGKAVMALRDTDSNVSQDLFGVTFIADGNFHHLAMVRDMAAGELRLYVDGLLEASAPLNASATGAIKDDDGEPDPFLIGASIQAGTTTRELFFSGLIDEVEFYNRALSASEIQAIFNAGSAGKCVYAFEGFFPPVDNLPTLNRVNAGRAIPVKFSLGGDEGLSIFAPGYPKSQPISCATSVPVDDVEETVTPGASALSYDAATDTYTYVWKTDKAWAGTCRQLIVTLKDNSEHRANFNFIK